MKNILKIFFVLIAIGFSRVCVAEMQPQTDDCGSNMTQLRDIIRSKFFGVFDANYDRQLVGTWSHFIISFPIESDGDILIRGELYMICPQANHTFYLYKKSDPQSSTGFAELKDGKIVIYDAHGLLGWAEGEYSRSAP